MLDNGHRHNNVPDIGTIKFSIIRQTSGKGLITSAKSKSGTRVIDTLVIRGVIVSFFEEFFMGEVLPRQSLEFVFLRLLLVLRIGLREIERR